MHCRRIGLILRRAHPNAHLAGSLQSVEEASPFTDVFAALDESARKAWANDWDPKRTIDATIESLSQLDVQLNIEVRLVCFNGQG